MILTLSVSLMMAISQVESGGDYSAVGDHGKAFGAYQFHRAAWVRFGGKPADWGHASPAEQDRVMMRALNYYLATVPAGIDPVRWVGTWHNTGHGLDRETVYVKKLRKQIRKQQNQ